MGHRMKKLEQSTNYTQTGIEEWIDAQKYKPEPFELVILKTKDKVAHGWYKGDFFGKGNEWFGLRLKEKPKVLYWKQPEESFIGGPKYVG